MATPPAVERRRQQRAVRKRIKSRQNPYELVGLNPRDIWVLTALLLAGSGFCGLVAWALSPAFNDTMGAVAIAAILLAPLMLLGAKHFPDAWWGTHVRMIIGSSLLLIDGLVMGPAVTAALTWVLVTMVSVAYLQTAKAAVPYVTAGLVATGWVIVHSGAPSAELRALVSLVVFGQIIFAVLLSQQLLRSVASASIERSLSDPLTSLSNLRFLRLRIGQELARGNETGDWPVLLNIDLDDFKRVNDTLGHSIGDTMLTEVGRAIRSRVEATDVVSRRGGDEFSVLVPSASERDIALLAQRLSEGVQLARSRVAPNGASGGSVGVAIARFGDDADKLIERADDALHAAKVEARGEEPLPRSPNNRSENQTTTLALDELAKEQRLTRRAEFALGVRLAWLTLAAATGLVATTIGVAVLAGWAPDLNQMSDWIALPIAYAASALFICGAWRRWPTIAVHGGFLIATLILSYVVFKAGYSRQALADFYLLIFVGPFLFFPLKQAAPWAAGAMALFATALFTSTYDYSVLRVSFTAITLSYIAIDLARARSFTRDYARGNLELSAIDGLTGVANLRGLRLALAQALQLANEEGMRFALISVDLDDFKSVNDRLSHSVGDQTLKAAAEAIREAMRVDDIVARRGGDEFSVVCEVSDDLPMDEVSARIRGGVRAARHRLCPDLEAGVSIGWTEWREGDTVGTMMARADRELHDSKSQSHAERNVAFAG